MRASGSDKGIQLAPPLEFSLERAIEYIAPDELVEATPQFLRMRKRILDSNVRRKIAKAAKTSRKSSDLFWKRRRFLSLRFLYLSTPRTIQAAIFESLQCLLD